MAIPRSVIPLHQAEIRRITTLVANRELKPRDPAVFFAVLLAMNPVTMQCRLGAAFMAEQLGMQKPHVVSSVTRLVRHKVLQRTYDQQTGDPILSLSDEVVDLAMRQAVAAQYQLAADALC